MLVCDFCGEVYETKQAGVLCSHEPAAHQFKVGQTVWANFPTSLGKDRTGCVRCQGTITEIGHGTPTDRYGCSQIDGLGHRDHGWVVQIELSPGQEPAPFGDHITTWTWNNIESIQALDA